MVTTEEYLETRYVGRRDVREDFSRGGAELIYECRTTRSFPMSVEVESFRPTVVSVIVSAPAKKMCTGVRKIVLE